MAFELPPAATGTPAPLTLTRADAERLLGGRWHGSASVVTVRGASIDSRALQPGNAFACLAGERHDGHDHATQAAAAGAALILAARPLPPLAAPVVVVEDVVQALAALATRARAQLGETMWIGVTGSSGKTTVKELLAAACGAAGATFATPGNRNNHLGVPLAVLAVPEHTRFAVIEMGANHQGEIAALAAIAQPQVGVITCIGPAHLEGFGGIEGVAKGKSELFAALPPGAPALLGVTGMDLMAARLGVSTARLLEPVRAAAAGRRLQLVGSSACPVLGEVHDDGIVLSTGDGQARLALLGAHNLANAALAYHAAVSAGVPGATALAGLGRVRPVPGRLTLRAAGSHRILDDTYNANPASMIAALQVLARSPRPLAVLGAMGELGEDREAGHRMVGAEAARLGLPVIVIGAAAAPILEAYHAGGGAAGTLAQGRAAALAPIVAHLAGGPATILVKASRSAQLEDVVAMLLAHEAHAGQPC